MNPEDGCRDCFLTLVVLFTLCAWSFTVGWYLGEQMWDGLWHKLGLAVGISFITFFGVGALIMSKPCCDVEANPRHESW